MVCLRNTVESIGSQTPCSTSKIEHVHKFQQTCGNLECSMTRGAWIIVTKRNRKNRPKHQSKHRNTVSHFIADSFGTDVYSRLRLASWRRVAYVRILIAEDDPQTQAYLSRGLKELGHAVVSVGCGREATLRATEDQFDVIVLDRMLPSPDGLTVLRTIRGAGVQTPVLFVTALASVAERVAGLEAGGDDYLAKPFDFSEFVARVNALARRPAVVPVETVLRVVDLELDTLRHTVRRAGRVIELQPREFKLLEYLMRNAGAVITRTMLLEHVWEFNFEPKTKVVETHVSRLRSKIDRDFELQLIRTVRGVGYSLDIPT